MLADQSAAAFRALVDVPDAGFAGNHARLRIAPDERITVVALGAAMSARMGVRPVAKPFEATQFFNPVLISHPTVPILRPVISAISR